VHFKKSALYLSSVQTREFVNFLRSTLAYPFEIKQNFATFEQDGRTFLVDVFDGDIFAMPTPPDRKIFDRITTNCPKCYHYSTPEAAFNCMAYMQQGFLHPTHICIVTDFAADRRMVDMIAANQALGHDLSPVQLKILSVIVAIHAKQLPEDIQEKILLVSGTAAFRKGECPYFQGINDVKVNLIHRQIARHNRKRHFLDVLLKFQYILDSHHSVGVLYFDRRIAELESQLAKIRAGQA
jgi:hypothetical protein